jgi:hypothetical protein
MLQRGSFLPLIVLLLSGALGAVFLAFSVRDDLRAADFVRAAPRASLDRPRGGPAIYAGAVLGPDDRADARGVKAAAHWWWVAENKGEDTWEARCFRREIRGLRLRDAAGNEAPITAFDTDESLSLVADDRDDFADPLFVDLASEPRFETPVIPPAAASCSGPNRQLRGRAVPPSAQAEVLACFAGGELGRCHGRPAAILALGGMARHRARRIDHAKLAVAIGASIFWALCVGAALLALSSRRNFEVVGDRRA